MRTATIVPIIIVISFKLWLSKKSTIFCLSPHNETFPMHIPSTRAYDKFYVIGYSLLTAKTI